MISPSEQLHMMHLRDAIVLGKLQDTTRRGFSLFGKELIKPRKELVLKIREIFPGTDASLFRNTQMTIGELFNPTSLQIPQPDLEVKQVQILGDNATIFIDKAYGVQNHPLRRGSLFWSTEGEITADNRVTPGYSFRYLFTPELRPITRLDMQMGNINTVPSFHTREYIDIGSVREVNVFMREKPFLRRVWSHVFVK